ncbi:MAG: LPS export ABC transporter permease LptG [Desulfobacterales bacterium]|jgi:lipopolysaccharide export system permease protein|nr:LPS export ABC transporter permease LptG [Desulfobacterales bacterium]
MTIIHSYITRLFFKYFFMILGMVIFIYLTIDFFGRIDNFLAASMPTSRILAFFLYRIPLIVSQITPAALLLSVLVVFGLMSKNNEIVALKSGGISEYYLVMPVVVIGLCLSVALFFFTETIAPITNAQASKLVEKRKNKRNLVTSTEKNIWIRGDHTITHIMFYNPVDQTIKGVSIVHFDEKFQMTRKIDARQGEFRDGRWVLSGCLTQSFDVRSEAGQTIFTEKEIIDIDLIPEDLKRIEQESEEMSFSRILEYIRKIEKQGYDATKYRVDVYAKTAFPFVCLIMSLIGSGLALRGRTREGMAVSFAYGILTAFGYWGIYSFCLSLGYGDMIPPLIAAWTANTIFFCIGGLLLLNIE